MENILKIFAERLKELREEKNLSQVQLSKETGIGQSSINYYESGLRSPNVITLVILSRYFGVTVGYLLGEED